MRCAKYMLRLKSLIMPNSNIVNTNKFLQIRQVYSLELVVSIHTIQLITFVIEWRFLIFCFMFKAKMIG